MPRHTRDNGDVHCMSGYAVVNERNRLDEEEEEKTPRERERDEEEKMTQSESRTRK